MRIVYLAVLPLLSLGCSNKAEQERLQAELAQSKAEMAQLQAQMAMAMRASTPAIGLADELERLKKLETTGILTKEEFETQKKAMLGRASALAPAPTPFPALIVGKRLTMTEAAEQFRTLYSLYNNNTINNIDRDERKKLLLEKTILMTDLKKDLELVASLYNENIISNLDRDALKKKLLSQDPVGK